MSMFEILIFRHHSILTIPFEISRTFRDESLLYIPISDAKPMMNMATHAKHLKELIPFGLPVL